jgi:quercetin dioxygenase-like cupin family protein
MRKNEDSERIVSNIKTTRFKPYGVDGKVLADQSYLQLDETFPESAGFYIYRMEPGASSQPHDHTCHESFLMIEGELIDNDRYVYKPGDFVPLKQGTQHNSYTKTGATISVCVRELERNL